MRSLHIQLKPEHDMRYHVSKHKEAKQATGYNASECKNPSNGQHLQLCNEQSVIDRILFKGTRIVVRPYFIQEKIQLNRKYERKNKKDI